MASSTSKSSVHDQDDLDDMMKRLELTEEDLDDVVYEMEDPPPTETTRWLAVVRVHMEKEFSEFWFYKNIRIPWDLAKDVKFRSLGNNMFTTQSTCLGDWDKVMDGGPRTYRDNADLMATYDGFSKLSLIQLNSFKIWSQIHDLSSGYSSMVKSLASKVGFVSAG